jgi:hypothetical protein
VPPRQKRNGQKGEANEPKITVNPDSPFAGLAELIGAKELAPVV